MTSRASLLAATVVSAGLFGAGPLVGQQPAASGRPGASQPAASGAANASQPAALAVVQRAAARYRGATAICADFAQELTIPLLGRKTNSKGQMCLKTPGLFAMTFSDPRGDRIVVDGTSLWVYQPSSQKTVFQTPAATGNALDFRREFLDDPAGKYNLQLIGKETVDGKPTDRVRLVPKQRSQYRDAQLWIGADSVVRRVQYTEENQNVKVLSLTNINLRANPSADMFRFTPPAGVQVMKQP